MSTVMTTQINSGLAQWLDQMARQMKVTKRSIIEEALTSYQKQLREEQIKQMFCDAAKESDIVSMADDGLDDSLEQIKSINNA